MGDDIRVDVEVDKSSLQATVEKLESKLKDGAEDGLENVLESGKEAAQTRVQQERRPFTSPHLHSSFTTFIIGFGDAINGHVENKRQYAAYVDQGVSGTERKRDTPFSYSDEMPPLDPLLEWVQDNMGGWSIETDPPFGGSGGGSKTTEDDRNRDEDSPSSTVKNFRETARKKFNEKVDYDEDVYSSKTSANLRDKSKFEDALKETYNEYFEDGGASATIDELNEAIVEWKTGTDDYTNRLMKKHLINTALTFDVDGTHPGSGLVSEMDESTLEEFTDSRYQAVLQMFKAISEEMVKNSDIETEDGKLTAYRNLRWATASVTQQLFDDPNAPIYTADQKPLENYALDRDKLTHISASSYIHERSVDIEDDLFYYVDAFYNNEWDNETEIHTRAGFQFSFDRNDLDVRSDRYFDALDRITGFQFEQNMFGPLQEPEMIALAGPVTAMGRRDIIPQTRGGRQRLQAFGEEFLDRELYEDAAVAGDRADWVEWTGQNISTIDEYDIPVIDIDNFLSFRFENVSDREFRKALEEIPDPELEYAIWHPGDNNLLNSQYEILQAYLWLKQDNNKIPVFGSSSERKREVELDFFLPTENPNNVGNNKKTERAEELIEEGFKKSEPAVAAQALGYTSNIKLIEHQKRAGSYKPDTNELVFNVADKGFQVGKEVYEDSARNTIAHEIGHMIHLFYLGIPATDYDDIDNRGKDPDDWEFGITESELAGSEISKESFDYFKKLWDKYKQDPSQVEIREYQWKHPIELLGVTHGNYIEDPEKLKTYMPEMYLFWERFEKGKESTDSVEDLEVGSTVVTRVSNVATQQPHTVVDVEYEDGEKVVTLNSLFDRESKLSEDGDRYDDWTGVI